MKPHKTIAVAASFFILCIIFVFGSFAATEKIPTGSGPEGKIHSRGRTLKG